MSGPTRWPGFATEVWTCWRWAAPIPPDTGTKGTQHATLQPSDGTGRRRRRPSGRPAGPGGGGRLSGPVRHLLGRRLAYRPGTRPGHHPAPPAAVRLDGNHRRRGGRLGPVGTVAGPVADGSLAAASAAVGCRGWDGDAGRAADRRRLARQLRPRRGAVEPTARAGHLRQPGPAVWLPYGPRA